MSIERYLVNIMEAANHSVMNCSENANVMHGIYVTARDALDELRGNNGILKHNGYVISQQALDFMKDDKKINAIREVRATTGLGLYEAKNLVESYIEKHHPELH